MIKRKTALFAEKLFFQSQNFFIKIFIRFPAGKIIESLFGYPDDMISDEPGSFAGSVFGMFHAAFPFQNSPTVVIILGKLTENSFKVHLPVAQGAKASRAVSPILVSAINARSARRVRFGSSYLQRL